MTIAEMFANPELVECLKEVDAHREHIPLLKTILDCTHCQKLLGTVLRQELEQAGIPREIL